MRVYQIEGSENSPWVWLDEKSGMMEISGVSAFRDPFPFYQGLARWIHAFNLKEHKTRSVDIRFEYLDEASVTGMEIILHQLYESGKENDQLNINWYYPKNNFLVKRIGMLYALRSRVPFRVRERNGEQEKQRPGGGTE